ncbi:chitin disaccharide deacetylase [Azospirillaceae bacterium]
MTRLIVTADDFGLAEPVNEAVERAHRDGILTAASLMVGADAAADAVDRARRLPKLGVGLHVVLVDGRPLLPPEQVPALVGTDGWFRRDLVAAGINFFFHPAARRQLAAEIRAQFEAFRQTRLRLDHVNAHCHIHLHPTVLGLILRIGQTYGVRAVRLPCEPSGGGALAPWLWLLRTRLRRAGVICNDVVLGLRDTGAMTEERVLALLAELKGMPPDTVVELYFHPATRRCPEINRSMPSYQHEAELAALLSPHVRSALKTQGIILSRFDALTASVMT